MPAFYERDKIADLCNLLLRDKSRKAVADAHERLVSIVRQDSEAAHEDDPALITEDRAFPFGHAFVREFDLHYDEMVELAEKLLADAIEPRLVTADELTVMMRSHLRVQPDKLDDAYSSMVGSIFYDLAVPRSSLPFPIGHVLGYFHGNSDDTPSLKLPVTEDGSHDVFWWRNGIGLRFNGTAPASFDPNSGAGPNPYHSEFLVYADVSGCATSGAMSVTANRLRRAAPSVFWSVYWVSEGKPLIVLTQMSLPPISEDWLEREARLIEGCFEAVFTPAKKSTFDRRIHNAVSLLVEADAQAEDFLGIALCIAAIEALLGRNEAELSSALADSVAVMLEPDLMYRADAADYVKRLYGIRSKVLHGEKLEASRAERESARFVAACV